MPRNLSGVYSLPAGSIVVDGVDDIQASQHNTPLQDIASDMNDPRPIVAGGTGATTIAGARGALRVTGSTLHSTVGGSANAITLTTGAGLSSLVTGMQVSFFPAANNTSGFTINVDGIGAVAARTIGQEVSPADYIVAGVLTVARYNGTIWIVDRQPESSTGANGNFTRFADGTQICTHIINLGSRVANGSGTYSNPYRTAEANWTFEKPFSSNPTITIVPRIDTATGQARNGIPAFRTISTTGITGILLTSGSDNSTAVDVIAHVTATGNWF
jgi:hypothetical protein